MTTDAPTTPTVEALEDAINRGDTRLSVALELVNAYESAGRRAEALALLARVASLAPRADVQRRLALMARRVGRPDVAATALQRWAELAPDDPVAHHLAAAANGVTPPRADAGYVRALFDGYANHFDQHIEGLGYRAPSLVASAIDRVAPGRRFERVVDLGCGTGLLGVELRPRADRLEGVDLSTAMLARARDRRIYDDLHEADLAEFLPAVTGIDLMAAADTLNYFGELAGVFKGAAAALANDGLFAFTLEYDGACADYRLQRSGRFVHSERWVLEGLQMAGFRAVDVDRATLRHEGGAEVHGLVVVAVAP